MASKTNINLHYESKQPIGDQVVRFVFRVCQASAVDRKIPRAEVQRSIARALRILTRMDTSELTNMIKSDQKAMKKEKETRKNRSHRMLYFSNQSGGLVEFFRDEETNKARRKLVTLHGQKELNLNQPPNDVFKEAIRKRLEAYALNDIKEAVTNGIIKLVDAAEGFAGPFEDGFPQQQPLLEQLRIAYKNCTSEEALVVGFVLARDKEAFADLRHEEDAFFMEG